MSFRRYTQLANTERYTAQHRKCQLLLVEVNRYVQTLKLRQSSVIYCEVERGQDTVRLLNFQRFPFYLVVVFSVSCNDETIVGVTAAERDVQFQFDIVRFLFGRLPGV